MPGRLVPYLRSLLFRRRLEREMQEEMDAHLKRTTERLAERGFSAEDAERAARREFGNVGSIQEDARDARGGRWLERLVADASFAWRYFRRRPLLSGTVVGVLSLGIGINVAFFVTAHSAMTMPAPGIERDSDLVRIRGLTAPRIDGQIGGQWLSRLFSYPELMDHAAHDEAFADVAAWSFTTITLGLEGDPPTLVSGRAHYVTGNYFPLLGVEAVLGSVAPLMAPSDASDPPPAVVVGYSFWQEELTGRSDVLESTIRVNGHSFDIVGVAPPRFAGPDATGSDIDVWLPLSARPLVSGGGGFALASYDSTLFTAVGRLQPDASLERATAVAATVAAAAADLSTRRRANEAWSADVAPLLAGNMRPNTEDVLAVAALGLVISLLSLAVTSMNVASLLVGASVARRREIAARLALGAPRSRIVRQLLTETSLLSGGAGLLGIFIVTMAARFIGPHLPELHVTLGWPALVFTMALSLGTGVVFGLSPALHATRVAVAEILKDTATGVSGTRMRLQRGLVIGQVAATQPLLVGLAAMLLLLLGDVRDLGSTSVSHEILWLDLGPVLTAEFVEEREARAERVRDRLVGAPGIVSVAPNAGFSSELRVSAHPADAIAGVTPDGVFDLPARFAAPGFFETVGLPIVSGRDFDPSERPPAPRETIVVTEELARRLWGDASPLGRRILSYEFTTTRSGESERFTRTAADAPRATELTVIGVVRQDGRARTGPGIRSNDALAYVPFGMGWGAAGLLIRTEGPAEPLVPAIHAMAQEVNPDRAVSSVTLAELEARSRRAALNAGAAAAAGGLLALLLSAVGLYAVVAFSVAQRTREIGIRAAIGASPGRIAGMFLRQGMRLSSIGLLLGLPLSLLAWRFLTGQLGVPPVSTPFLLAAVASAVLAVATVAAWAPARRAAAVAPFTSLRAD